MDGHSKEIQSGKKYIVERQTCYTQVGGRGKRSTYTGTMCKVPNGLLLQ